MEFNNHIHDPSALTTGKYVGEIQRRWISCVEGKYPVFLQKNNWSPHRYLSKWYSLQLKQQLFSNKKFCYCTVLPATNCLLNVNCVKKNRSLSIFWIFNNTRNMKMDLVRKQSVKKAELITNWGNSG